VKGRGVRVARGQKESLSQRCTFPQWDKTDRTVNIEMPTESELNITATTPIQDPSMGPFIPHLNFKRAM
jgi:hypothetical protein